MATDKAFVERVTDTLVPLDVRTRAMFGEYCLYCDDKVAGFICDNTVFLKPTGKPNPELDALAMGECYPGSKMYHIVPDDRLDDPEWLRPLVQWTADQFPAKKAKKKA